jgi:hypothetical protein
MAKLYFTTQEQINMILGSPEGLPIVANLPKFVTGGVTMMVGATEE